MASIDFKTYCEAESKERLRAARIYLGEESDPGLNAEHYIPGDLPKLLEKQLPQNLASIYTQEYSVLQASLRAAAISNLRREHYYEYAAQEAKREQARYNIQLANHERDANFVISSMPQQAQLDLQSINDTEEINKSTIRQQIEAQKGNSSPITLRSIVQMIMSLRHGVNPFGTSSEVPNALTPYDSVTYEGIRANLVCACCHNLLVEDSFIEMLESLEANYGKLRISSGYRCISHNKRVGGADSSYHLKGQAVDILVRSREDRDTLEAIAKNVGFKGGFGRANSFLHIDTGPSRYWDYGGSV